MSEFRLGFTAGRLRSYKGVNKVDMELGDFRMDALREVVNIGVGNAATSLAQMIGKKVAITVPRAEIVALEEAINRLGGPEEMVSCINFTVSGDVPALIVLLFGESSSYLLPDLVLGRKPGTTRSLGEMEISLLSEVGNILASSFLNAISMVGRMTFVLSVPAFCFDMLGAVFSTALLEGGYFADKVLMIEVDFFESETYLRGHFFLLPEIFHLEQLFLSLGVSELGGEV